MTKRRHHRSEKDQAIIIMLVVIILLGLAGIAMTKIRAREMAQSASPSVAALPGAENAASQKNAKSPGKGVGGYAAPVSDLQSLSREEISRNARSGRCDLNYLIGAPVGEAEAAVKRLRLNSYLVGPGHTEADFSAQNRVRDVRIDTDSENRVTGIACPAP